MSQPVGFSLSRPGRAARTPFFPYCSQMYETDCVTFVLVPAMHMQALAADRYCARTSAEQLRCHQHQHAVHSIWAHSGVQGQVCGLVDCVVVRVGLCAKQLPHGNTAPCTAVPSNAWWLRIMPSETQLDMLVNRQVKL
mgnify:CR=1 FL=1